VVAVGPEAASVLPTARRPARLADPVVEFLAEQIVSGAIAPNSVLPPESALGQAFQVSRITVREAVKLLEAKGLVGVRQGVGAVVNPDTKWNFLDPVVLAAAVKQDSGLTLLDELVDVRVKLEASLAARAAHSATAADLADLEEVFHRLEAQVGTPEAFVQTDVEFHDRIMAVSKNRLARSIVSAVHSQARTSMLYQGHPSVADVKVTNEEHRKILERVADGDADGAAAAMTAHILDAWGRRRPTPARTARRRRR
jgi:DNA-binding FadR family transcriptional regulator